MKKRIKRRLKDYPTNVPRKLFQALKRYNFNRSLTASALDINSGHLSKLLNDGIEPKDNTIRRKMYLKTIKTIKQRVKRERVPEPVFIKLWKHLPTDERHKVIKQYLKWKEMQWEKI